MINGAKEPIIIQGKGNSDHSILGKVSLNTL